MTTCAFCDRPVIICTYAGEPILLDAHGATYVAVDFERLYPEEGDRVVRSMAFVAHEAVCPGKKEERRPRPKTRKAGEAGAPATPDTPASNDHP